MSHPPTNYLSEAQTRHAVLKARLLRNARRAVKKNRATLVMLCSYWGGDERASLAAERFIEEVWSDSTTPHQWPVDQIVSILSSGASDVDVGARRIVGLLRGLLADLDELSDLTRQLEPAT